MAHMQPADSHDHILAAAARLYGLAPDHLAPIMVGDGNCVFEYQRDGAAFILKWTPSADRAIEQIRAEVAWVDHLAQHGVPVARPIPSITGALVEVIPVGEGYVSVASYTKAPGRRPVASDFSAALFQDWGQILGRMHTLAVRYAPDVTAARSRTWYEQDQLALRHIPPEQTMVREKWHDLMRYFHRLPTDREVYGLIHGDFQANNLMLADGHITVFDFDACQYDWFMNDIARALYFVLWERPPGFDNHAFATFFMDNLLDGYRSAKRLDNFWLEQLPRFLKLQEMLVYVAINAYNDLAGGLDIATIHPKHQRLLARYRHNIEHGIPYIASAYNPWMSAT